MVCTYVEMSQIIVIRTISNVNRPTIRWLLILRALRSLSNHFDVCKTSCQSNVTQDRIAAANERFSRIRQVAPTCTASNIWSRGPTRVLNPNGISVGSAVFAGLTIVRDRQTDRTTHRQTGFAKSQIPLR